MIYKTNRIQDFVQTSRKFTTSDHDLTALGWIARRCPAVRTSPFKTLWTADHKSLWTNLFSWEQENKLDKKITDIDHHHHMSVMSRCSFVAIALCNSDSALKTTLVYSGLWFTYNIYIDSIFCWVTIRHMRSVRICH